MAPPLPATTLKVIAYNVWDLKYLIAQNGQRERTCRIPRKIFELQPDVDVLVINEIFIGGCIVNVNNSLTGRDLLKAYGFTHYTRTVGDDLAVLPSGKDKATTNRNKTADNGGVFIASRWPILKEEQIVYENYDNITADAFSAKGAMYAKVNKTVDGANMIFHIFGTHLQATEKPLSPGVRVLQAGEMFEFMTKMAIPVSEPVIYAGDLNGDLINKRENALAIMNALDATMPELVGPLEITYDTENNDNLGDEPGKASEFLDYVLVSNGHVQPSKATLEVIRPHSEEAFDVCRDFRILKLFMYPHSPDCRQSRRVSDLSDHYAVLGLLEYVSAVGNTPSPAFTSVFFLATLIAFVLA